MEFVKKALSLCPKSTATTVKTAAVLIFATKLNEPVPAPPAGNSRKIDQ